MSNPPERGDPAPGIRLPSTEGEIVLADLIAGGERVVLAFYTEDGTPSCQTQIAMLIDAHDMMREFGARVIAVSADSLESHAAFAERLGGVPFPLASDADLRAARAFGVDDDSAGRSGRAVFVIDRDGTVLLAIPHFQPGNVSQFEAIFAALGAE